MKTFHLFLVALTAAGITIANAQTIRESYRGSSYSTAIGLRAGETSGMTFKHFFNDVNAFEGIIGVWPYALGITGLYETHKPAFETEGFKWYYGGGAHARFGTNRIYYVYRNGERYYYRYSSGKIGLGLDGILGLEYKINPIPFALSLDIKPFMEIDNDGIFYMSVDPGLGIKVAF
jgi:hypothetical protein